MFTSLYRMALAPAGERYRIVLLFTRQNGDFGAIYVTEGASPRRSGKWSVTYRIGSVPHFGAV